MIYVIGIAITFFLSFILLTKKNKSLADKILVVWLLVIAWHLALYECFFTKAYLQFPHILGFEKPLPLLHGPLLFLYTKSLTSRFVISAKKLLHFIPFFILSSKEKMLVYQNEGEPFTELMIIMFIAIILSGAVYSILSLNSLLKYKRQLKEIYSYTEKINLQWLFNLIIGLSCIWVIVFFAEDELIFSAVVIYVLFIGYFGIKQVGIFYNQQAIENTLEPEIIDQLVEKEAIIQDIKYDKSLLNDSQLRIIHAHW